MGRNCREFLRHNILFFIMVELINRIRDNQKNGMKIMDAVNVAVDSCIADGIMEEFLVKQRNILISTLKRAFDKYA